MSHYRSSALSYSRDDLLSILYSHIFQGWVIIDPLITHTPVLTLIDPKLSHIPAMCYYRSNPIEVVFPFEVSHRPKCLCGCVCTHSHGWEAKPQDNDALLLTALATSHEVSFQTLENVKFREELTHSDQTVIFSNAPESPSRLQSVYTFRGPFQLKLKNILICKYRRGRRMYKLINSN